MRRILAVVLLCLPSTAHPEPTHHLEVVPMVGMRMGGSITVEDRAFHREDLEVGIASNASFGFRLGIPISDRFEVEGLFSHQNTTFADQDGLFGERPGGFFEPGDRSFLDLGITSYGVGLRWTFHRGWSEVFLVAGGGLSQIDPSLDLPSSSRLSLNGGGGVGIPLDDRLGLRAEWRTYWTNTDDTVTGVAQYEHSDCFDPCTYTYRYRPNLTQGELSAGLTLKF